MVRNTVSLAISLPCGVVGHSCWTPFKGERLQVRHCFYAKRPRCGSKSGTQTGCVALCHHVDPHETSKVIAASMPQCGDTSWCLERTSVKRSQTWLEHVKLKRLNLSLRILYVWCIIIFGRQLWLVFLPGP